MSARTPSGALAPSRAVRAAHLAVLVALTWSAFAPALAAEFVNWDDRENFLENPAYRGFSAEHLRWMFTTTHLGPYQPLSWLTLAFDHAVAGLDARVYHRTNLVLHVLGAIALWALARRVLDDLLGERTGPGARAFGALGAALLFAVHPLRVESVAWVTERRDVLCAPFFFLSLLAWWRYASAPPGRGRRDYLLALAALLLSLLAKASAIVMPALLVLIDLGPLRAAARARGRRRLLLEKLPVLALVVPFAWIAVVGQERDAAMASAEVHGPLTRGIQAGWAAWFYASRTLAPSGHLPIHRLPALERFFDADYLAPALGVLAVSAACALLWRRIGATAWAWWAFLVILAPVSGLAQSGGQIAAERYSYLACAPFALLAGGGLAWLAARRRAVAWCVLAAAAGTLAWRANAYTRAWHDSWSLWAHTLAVDPDNDVALINLAVLELETAQSQADPARARELLHRANEHAARAVAIKPEPRRLFNLAATHVKLADYEPEREAEHVARAVETAERAHALAVSLGVRMDPRWGAIRALALYYAQRWPDALAAAQETLRATPRDLDLRRLAADVLGRLGRAPEAVTLLEETLRFAPDDALVWLELSRAWERAGDAAKARDAARAGRERAERKLGARAAELPGWAELVRRGL